MTILINADDFGLSSAVNRAIVNCFERGLISRTTILANASAFEEAVSLAQERRLLDNVGIHFVLTDGEPLSDPIRRQARLCGPDGQFCYSRPGNPLFFLSAEEREAVGREFLAQIARCRDAGLKITHCDSHHHVHNEWPIFGIVRAVAHQAGLRSCRLARNCGSDIGPAKRLYKFLLNTQIRRSGLALTDYFGSVEDVLDAVRRDPACSAEVMVHPVYDGELLLDGYEGGLLEDLVGRMTASGQAR